MRQIANPTGQKKPKVRSGTMRSWPASGNKSCEGKVPEGIPRPNFEPRRFDPAYRNATAAVPDYQGRTIEARAILGSSRGINKIAASG